METHDFGTILAQGQQLTHNFVINNPGTQPRRIVGALALTSCCSSIGPLPESIPPGGRVSVPAILKAGHRSTPKRVEFVVRTDGVRPEIHRFFLTANFLSVFEVEPLDPEIRPLRMGQSGRQRFAIICRRGRDGGLGIPSSVEADPPLSARLTTPAVETDLGGGILESRMEVEIHLPATDRKGPRSGAFRVHWSSGESREYALSWQVTPWIRVTPATIILDEKRGRGPVSITLATDDAPFKVLDISGPLLVGHGKLSREPRRLHPLRLELDPTGKHPTTHAITIMTDRPEQPVVRLGVIVVPAETGEKP